MFKNFTWKSIVPSFLISILEYIGKGLAFIGLMSKPKDMVLEPVSAENIEDAIESIKNIGTRGETYVLDRLFDEDIERYNFSKETECINFVNDYIDDDLIRNEDKIEMIKQVKQLTGFDLRKAKGIVDKYFKGLE
jgi:hypothetical protein